MPDFNTIDAIYKTKLLGPISEHVGTECWWVEYDNKVLWWDHRRDQYVATIYTTLGEATRGYYAHTTIKGLSLQKTWPAFAAEVRITGQALRFMDVNEGWFARICQHQIRRSAETLRRNVDDYHRTLSWDSRLLENRLWEEIEPERDFVHPLPHSKEAVKRFWFDVCWDAEDRLIREGP